MHNQKSLDAAVELLCRNIMARQHFLTENRTFVGTFSSHSDLVGPTKVSPQERQQLLACLDGMHKAEEARIKEDYASFLSFVEQHPYCLEQLSKSSLILFASSASVAETFAVIFAFMDCVPLPPELQLEMGYVLALYNSYLDSNIHTPTLGILAIIVAVIQAEVVFLMRVLTSLTYHSSGGSSALKQTQPEMLFGRFLASLRAYIGADEPYFLSKRQKKVLTLYREELKVAKDDTEEMPTPVALGQLIEKYRGFHFISTGNNGTSATKRAHPKEQVQAHQHREQKATHRLPSTPRSSVSSARNTMLTGASRQLESRIKRLNNLPNKPTENTKSRPRSAQNTTFHQKQRKIRYPSPPDVESKVSHVRIEPPLRLLERTNVGIFPVGYGPIDLMYKGYRVGIQEMLGFSKATFSTAMTKAYSEAFATDKADAAPNRGAHLKPQDVRSDASSCISAEYHEFIKGRQLSDVPMLAKVQTSWVRNRWIMAASYDPSDLQLLCLEQTMGSEVETALIEKQIDTEAIRHAITTWGDKCISIALKEPLPKSWTPILTQDGLYVRFLDNATGAIFSLHPEVREIQKQIDAQYKLLDKYMRLPDNSEIMKAYELVKALIDTGFANLELAKNTSGLFKAVVQRNNNLITGVGKIITRWAPLYNTSSINLQDNKEADCCLKLTI